MDKDIHDLNLNFKVALKLLPDKGNLVYEYNPFRNYRLDKDMYFYQNKFYTREQLQEELGITISSDNQRWEGVPITETPPILYQKGQLVDFITDELHFDLNHPVSILPSYSYDNSVDLILNDGKNQPRLINSRFSATERNQYEIIDRRGNNDTNIYDKGEQFDVDTSLYKKVTTIPELEFLGVGHGGNLSVGSYTFYFKYVDDDGNESDFFAESGQIQIFIGTTPHSIYSGFRDENSHKSVDFTLTNMDSAYQKVVVYYTKTTSDVNESAVTSAYRINNPFPITKGNLVKLTVTGYEEKTEVSIEEINEQLQRYSAVETQDVCQNMLFFGHNYKTKQHYDDLRDIALRFLPKVDKKSYTPLDSNYNGKLSETYFDPKFSYNYTGYWTDIYRFGVVFIYSDNTLSDVYDVRGGSDLTAGDETIKLFSKVSFKKDGNRNYINFDEYDYHILNAEEPGDVTNENCRGVISFGKNGVKLTDILGIKFCISQEALDYLKDELGIKGFFFVRKKRIPTVLCQAYTIGVDSNNNLPVLPKSSTTATEEGFLDKNSRELNHTLSSRIHELSNEQIRKQAAICPEYDVNSPYFNSLFTGGEFIIEPYNGGSVYGEGNTLLFNAASEELTENSGMLYTANIIGVEDNTKLVAIGDNKFSARAGEAEEAFRYEYIGMEIKSSECVNLTRGSYGPYLGMVGYENMGELVTIRIPYYSEADMDKYFQIRFNDPFPYYAISKRYNIYNDTVFDEVEISWKPGDNPEPYKCTESLYRGDCYICNYTHRLNRNFQDPSAPLNDDIVNPKCWKDNYEVEDGVVKKENFDKINLGDVNAVKMGRYVHMVVKANMNLNIRALDDSIPDEMGLAGHPRTFSPHCLTPINGAYKTPEALCYNKGFEKSVSEKVYFGLPDVPVLKEDFTNRISYSNIKITDSFQNGFRVFKGTHYRDYPKTYGSIIKIIESNGSLICVLEHGIYRIPVNERAVAAEGDGGMAYINTSNVLPENPDVLSDTYGSQWRDSVIKTPSGIYGVDTVGKKIWKISEKGFQIISDFKVQKFLNDNITLTERELIPIIGVRNVKTHYNKYKGDIMFTFYDNLYGFEERVWNLCYNENLDKWITFYSWVPSFSENIYNSYFSFDRNTSKWIAKLGISKHGNDFSDGVTLSHNIINPIKWDEDSEYTDYVDYRGIKHSGNVYPIGILYLDNRNLPEGTGLKNSVSFTLERDSYLNCKHFTIKKCTIKKKLINEESGETVPDLDNGQEQIESILPVDAQTFDRYCLCCITNPEEFYSQLYWRTVTRNHNKYVGFNPTVSGNNLVVEAIRLDEEQKYLSSEQEKDPVRTDLVPYYDETLWNPGDTGRFIDAPLYINSQGRKVWMDNPINADKIVLLLNIRAYITTTADADVELAEAVATGMANRTTTDRGYYESIIAVMPQYNMQYLTTDFWKHSQAGIIDIAEKIKPTHWYDKQHPFEFEFIVSNDIDQHKIFDNLEIIANNSEPESFHYEIIGDCYEFAKDKENMYIRQEATKHLWQYNGSDITYDHDYSIGTQEHRKIDKSNEFDRSTLFPLYFSRQDTINELEDKYNLANGSASGKDYSNMAGGEIVYYPSLKEYRIVNHAKAVDMKTGGRLRGNMMYNEDKWCVQINPLNIIQCNEPDWKHSLQVSEGPSIGRSYLVPVEINNSPIPEDIKDITNVEIPTDWDRGIVQWSEYKQYSTKLKDKFIRIRVRYSGKNPTIIFSLKTLYSISYA